MTATADHAPALDPRSGLATAPRPGPLSLGEILADFQVEPDALEDCDHVGTDRVQKFNAGAGAQLCGNCQHIVSYGFHPTDNQTDNQTDDQTETPESDQA